MKTGEFQQMRTRLAAANQPRRGWEWGFLSRLAERSLSTVIADETGLPVRVADDPLTCVARGAGRTLEDTVYRGGLLAA